MRVLYILRKTYPESIGGVELTYHFLLPALKNKGIQPIILSENYSGHYPFIKINRIWPNSVFFKTQVFFKLLFYANKYDCIHVPYMHTTSYFNWMIYPLIKLLLNKRYVASIHGGRMKKWKPEFPHKLFFKYAYKISAPTKDVALEYERRTGRTIDVVPSQIPLEKSKSNRQDNFQKFDLPDNCKIFLSVGSLKPIKSPETIVDSIKDLGVEFLNLNNIKFVFAGDGLQKENLEVQVKNSGLENHVIFTGNLNRSLLADLYSIAHCYIIASEFESFSKSVYEAIYFNIPIINSDVRVLNKTLTDKKTSLFFPFKDFKSLSEKIRDVVDNYDKAKKRAELAYEEHSSIFDYERNVVNRYLQLYKS